MKFISRELICQPNFELKTLDDYLAITNFICQLFLLLVGIIEYVILTIIQTKMNKINQQINQQNKMIKSLLLSNIGGSIIFPIYFIQSMRCNIRFIPFCFIANFMCTSYMLQYINQLNFVCGESKTIFAPLKKCYNLSNTINYWGKFHFIYAQYYIWMGMVEMVFEVFNGDLSLTWVIFSMHTIHNLGVLFLYLYIVQATIRFIKNKNKSNTNIKKIQLWISLFNAISMVILNIVFPIISAISFVKKESISIVNRSIIYIIYFVIYVGVNVSSMILAKKILKSIKTHQKNTLYL